MANVGIQPAFHEDRVFMGGARQMVKADEAPALTTASCGRRAWAAPPNAFDAREVVDNPRVPRPI